MDKIELRKEWGNNRNYYACLPDDIQYIGGIAYIGCIDIYKKSASDIIVGDYRYLNMSTYYKLIKEVNKSITDLLISRIKLKYNMDFKVV